MPRTTRSTPTPTPPVDATAPVPASPALSLPNPNPDRASATLVDSMTPLEDIPCFMPGALGVGMVLDLERVFLATGNSCADGSRFHVSCARARQERVLVGRVCWARRSEGSTTSRRRPTRTCSG